MIVYKVVESMTYYGNWRVEASDPDRRKAEECVAIFSSRKDAEEYAAWKNEEG